MMPFKPLSAIGAYSSKRKRMNISPLELNAKTSQRKTVAVSESESSESTLLSQVPQSSAQSEDEVSLMPPSEPSTSTMHDVGKTYHRVLMPISKINIYRAELRQQKALLPAATNKFIIPEYDFKKGCLMDTKYLLLWRHIFFIRSSDAKREEHTVISCSCDPEWQQTLSTMSEEVSKRPEIMSCIHIKVASKVINEMTSSYEIDDEDISTNSDDIPVGLEESFMVYRQNKLFVPEIRQYGNGDFFGIVGHGGGKMVCYMCPHFIEKCHHIKLIEDKENQDHPAIIKFLASCNTSQRKRNPTKCLSKHKIPLKVTPEYRQNIMKIITPSSHLKCAEILCSACGRNLSFSATTLLLFDESTVINDIHVYDGYCHNCERLFHYDGFEDGILRMSNFLIHHRVLRNYMILYLTGNSITFHHFHASWTRKMQEYGFDGFARICTYANFVSAWYSFRELLEVDLKDGFCCDECGLSPTVIVCDGTSLGFRRSLLMSAINSFPEMEIPIKRISTSSSRMAFENSDIRDQLQNLISKTGKLLSIEKLKLKSIQHRELKPFLKWLFETFQLDHSNVSCLPDGVMSFIRCMATTSPVCSYIYPSDSVLQLVLSLTEFPVRSDQDRYHFLQLEAPIIFNLVKDLGHGVLPQCFSGLIRYLLSRAQAPFLDSALPEIPLSENRMLACFPSQPVLRGRGYFEKDEDTTFSRKSRCQKSFNSHRKLTAGIFTVYCPHGICYGYSIMESAESPNIPFTILRTRWEKAPELVVYDFACSLHQYCLNRDPEFFKSTRFVVDRFHWANHKACSPSYNINLYGKYRLLNSQVNEQQNSTTKNLAHQVSYMTENHFKDHLTLFMLRKNEEKKQLF